MFSYRTRISIAQLLDLFQGNFVRELLLKHDISVSLWPSSGFTEDIKEAKDNNLATLITELAATRGDFRCRTSPRYRFDERRQDLEKCLLLDGYKIDGSEVIHIEPNLGEEVVFEDDLISDISQSGIPESESILQELEQSANDFRKPESDYVGALTHARIALETLVRSIAKQLGPDSPYRD